MIHLQFSSFLPKATDYFYYLTEYTIFKWRLYESNWTEVATFSQNVDGAAGVFFDDDDTTIWVAGGRSSPGGHGRSMSLFKGGKGIKYFIKHPLTTLISFRIFIFFQTFRNSKLGIL